MNKTRLEAFSDGVIAILITIMVLELKAPHESNLSALTNLAPIFYCYVMSFIYLGIYWNNHHHMLHIAEHTSGKVLWANMHLLFWLSLIPFTTSWMGENHFAPAPTALYGIILLLAAISYTLLQQTIIATNGRNSKLAKAVGKDFKGKISIVLYVTAIPLAFLSPFAACTLYLAVALIWLVPDRRIESKIN